MKVSAVIITKNEAHNIKKCLDSVSWADEIVVLDSGSEDDTVAICKHFGCKVHILPEWKGFGHAKQTAVNYASNDWIFSIDADEVVTDKLREAMLSTIIIESNLIAYKIKRSSFYLGKKIKHCGWNKDYPLRLFNKKFAAFNDKTVHESVQAPKEQTGVINEVMLHYTYPTVDDHLVKMQRYAELGSKSLFEKGRKSSPTNAIMRGLLKFVKMYLLQAGFLDGKIGFTLSLNSAYGVFLKYIKLWILNR